MNLELTLWLKRNDDGLTLECSDPPGKNDPSCNKIGITTAHYVVKLVIEADGAISQNTIRRVSLRPPSAVRAAKKAKSAPSSKGAKKAAKVKSDPPGKKAK